LIATLVYALCALTSLACAFLLLRQYRASGARLLMWAGLCFLGFALNNVLLVVDLGIATDVDLSAWRALPSLGGLACLIYGLVWES
jgi:hypothetical protein